MHKCHLIESVIDIEINHVCNLIKAKQNKLVNVSFLLFVWKKKTNPIKNSKPKEILEKEFSHNTTKFFNLEDNKHFRACYISHSYRSRILWKHKFH